MDVAERVGEIFGRAGVRGCLHVVDVDDPAGGEVALRADEQVVIASIFKIMVVLEFARQAAAGQLDPTERVLVGAADRLGGWGVAGCADDVEVSLRDLAYLAMSVSDNTAADLLLRRVGADVLPMLAAELDVPRTRIVGGPRQLVETMLSDVGARTEADFARIFPTLSPERVRAMRVFDPEHTSSSTARPRCEKAAFPIRSRSPSGSAGNATAKERSAFRRSEPATRHATPPSHPPRSAAVRSGSNPTTPSAARIRK